MVESPHADAGAMGVTLVREAPHAKGHLSPWTTAPEPSLRTRVPQQEKPLQREASALQLE